MEIFGVPLHPLVVHVVVMLVPVAALAGLALAFLPGWRWLTRWVALGASVGGLAAVVVARQSGKALLRDRAYLMGPDSPVRDVLQQHQDRAFMLLWSMVAFTAVTVVAFFLLPAASGLTTGKLAHTGRDEVWMLRALQVLLVVTGLLVLVTVVLTGDAGARSVWGS